MPMNSEHRTTNKDSSMKERPILFSGAMVRAILEGRKTQTRRVVKWKPREEGMNLNFSGLVLGNYSTGNAESGWVLRSRGAGGCWNDRTWPAHCPYGKPGDRLWVRETWQCVKEIKGQRFTCRPEFPLPANRWIEYFATPRADEPAPTWRPSIHMPRRASRISLDVVSRRVERLNEITEEDAVAEGIESANSLRWPGKNVWKNYIKDLDDEWVEWFEDPKESYRSLWESINGRGSWGENPWVWVVEFPKFKPGEGA